MKLTQKWPCKMSPQLKKQKPVAISKLVSCIYFENTVVIFIFYLIKFRMLQVPTGLSSL